MCVWVIHRESGPPGVFRHLPLYILSLSLSRTLLSLHRGGGGGGSGRSIMPAATLSHPAPAHGSPPPSSRLAPPGSRSSALQVSRAGLKLSPPSATAATKRLVGASADGNAGAKQIGAKQPPIQSTTDIHLWSVPTIQRNNNRKSPSAAAGGGAAAAAAAAADEGGGGGKGCGLVRVPAQSPLRRVEWFLRPPSPLVSHMRPLWESASSSGSNLSSSDGSRDTSATNFEAGPASRRRARPAGGTAARKEGKAAGPGEAGVFKPDTCQVCVSSQRALIFSLFLHVFLCRVLNRLY